MFQIKVVYEDYYLLGCNAVSSSKNVVTFQGNLFNLPCVCTCVFFETKQQNQKSHIC